MLSSQTTEAQVARPGLISNASDPLVMLGLPRIKQRGYGRLITVVLIMVVAGYIANAFYHGDIAWKVVGQFFTAPAILWGMANTIWMTICAMTLGVVLGVTFAVMYMSPNPVLRAVAWSYIWFFRGTPLLLQLLILFNLALVFPVIGIPGLFEAPTVNVITPFVATLIGLGMNQGAYTAEVVRGGILSVDAGQVEAAKSIGMTRLSALYQIVLPQAMRVIVPPIGNEVISMVKLTAIASVIGYSEILRNSQNIYYANGRVLELLIVTACWYLALVTLLQIAQFFVERYFSKGYKRRPTAKSNSAVSQ